MKEGEAMSIQRLPVFLSAAKHLNFTKAAKEHCISQTAVSQQIKLLEEEIGFQLFVREKRGVSLTAAGESFYHQCRILMNQYQSAILKGQRISQDNLTELHIGYGSAYDLWAMAKLIRTYRHAYPRRQVEFRSGNDQRFLEQILEGRIDMAVVTGNVLKLTDEIETRTIVSDTCGLMISASHPLAARKSIEPEELGDIPIVYNNGQNYRSYMTQLEKMYTHLGLNSNKRIYADDFSSLILIVNMGQAVSVMPCGARDMGIAGLKIIPIKGFRRTAQTMALYPRRNAAPVVRDLLKLL